MTKDLQELEQKKSFANLTKFFRAFWPFFRDFGSDKKLSKNSDKKITKKHLFPRVKNQIPTLYNIAVLLETG